MIRQLGILTLMLVALEYYGLGAMLLVAVASIEVTP